MKKLCIIVFVSVFSWGFSQVPFPELSNHLAGFEQMVVMPSGNIIFSTTGKNERIWMGQFDQTGSNLSWCKEVFGTEYASPNGFVWSENESCFYLGGSGLWDNRWKGFLVKLDSMGNLIQEMFVHPDTYEVFLTDFVVSEKNIFVIGSANCQNPTVAKSYICCFSDSFQEIWKTEFQDQGLEKILKTETGGMIIFGYTLPEGQNYIMKLDEEGNLIWKKVFPRVGQIYGAVADADDKFLITGKSSNGTFLKKFDSQGEILWEKEFNIRPGIESWTKCVFSLDDGSGDLILVGTIGRVAISETFVFRINGNTAETQWERYFPGGTSAGVYDPISGNIFLGGYTQENVPQVIVIFQGINPIDDENPQPKNCRLEQNYPNPFNATTTIEYALPVTSGVNITIYDMTGQIVSELINNVQEPGLYHAVWDAHEMASGVYFFQIAAISTDKKETFNSVKKMTLVK